MDIVGRQINNYEVRHLIGEGGMGAVYLAEHVIMGRKAAVKVLRGEFANDEMLIARFINEARAATAIGHPNIVDVVDVGRLPDGIPYMMMEFLDGENLAKRLYRETRLSPALTLHFATQAGSALEAAHQKGIVHRDLKPENLFLVPDPTNPGHDRVKVLDFGIAKLRGNFSKSDSMKTRTGSLMGTPPYMSPEQCRGISDAIDHRSDIYSFGIILYEMVVGRPPFVSEGFGEILMMHMQTPPEPPSSLCPDVPPAYEQTIMRALAKEPADRFASMTDLLVSLTAKTTGSTMVLGNSTEGESAHNETRILPAVSNNRVPTQHPPRREHKSENRTYRPPAGEDSGEREAVDTMLVPRRRGLVVAGVLAGCAVVGLVAYLVLGGSSSDHHKKTTRSPGALTDSSNSPSEVVVKPAEHTEPVAPPVVEKPVLATPDPVVKPEVHHEPVHHEPVAKPEVHHEPVVAKPEPHHPRPPKPDRSGKPADDGVEKW